MRPPKELGPLGLLPRHCQALDDDVMTRLRILDQLDLVSEKTSLFRHQPDQYLFIDVIERECKRFLSLPILVPEPDYSLAPPVLVDELWHELIINTPKYRSMCDEITEVILTTHRTLGYANELARTAGEIADYTRSLIAEYYGGLVQTIWATDVMRPCQPDVVKCTWPPPKLVADIAHIRIEESDPKLPT